MVFIWRKIVMKSGQALFKRYFCFVNVRLKKKSTYKRCYCAFCSRRVMSSHAAPSVLR